MSSARLVLLVAVLLSSAGRASAGPSPAIESAIAGLCRNIFGAGSHAVVTLGVVSLQGDGALLATPAPGSRLGQPSRFLLWRGGSQVGWAVATVAVTAPHLTAARRIERDETVEDTALSDAVGLLPSVGFTPLPDRSAVVAARSRRPIAAGEVIANGLVQEIPAVRTGDTVQAHLRRGRIEIVARVVASGTGRVGDVIQVRSSRAARTVAARISGPGAVEVMP